MSTNGWGKGSVNNSNGWGAGAINNDNGWGDLQLKSWSGDTDIDGGTGVPVNTLAPVISGGDTVGSTLTSTTGTWTGTPEPTFTFKWFRDSNEIVGANSNTYTLVDEDAETVIRSRVTATNIFGSDIKDSNIINVLPTTDPDAQAFITAAAITNPTQQSAINQLVTDLKGYGIWTKMKALYPFVGGTASSHKFNLKDPRDLDAAFRLVFNGGWTHSSNGALPNGTNGYADTKFIPSVNQNVNSNGLGCYITGNTYIPGDTVTMGAFNSSSQASILISKVNLNGTETLDGRLNAANSPKTIIGRAGSFDIQRTSANVTKLYKNSSVVVNYVSGGTQLPTLNVFLGNMSFQVNSPYGSGYTNSQFRFAYLSDGLSDAEVSNLRTAVQTFQTTLNRQIP